MGERPPGRSFEGTGTPPGTPMAWCKRPPLRGPALSSSLPLSHYSLGTPYVCGGLCFVDSSWEVFTMFQAVLPLLIF